MIRNWNFKKRKEPRITIHYDLSHQYGHHFCYHKYSANADISCFPSLKHSVLEQSSYSIKEPSLSLNKLLESNTLFTFHGLQRLVFGGLYLYGCPARYTTKTHTNQSNKLAYDLMSMTKEFNNKHDDNQTEKCLWEINLYLY